MPNFVHSFLLAVSVCSLLPLTRAHAAPFAYVANGNGLGLVSVIDLATDTEVSTIFTADGGDPYWVNISADGSVVAVSLHNSTGVALIDATTNTLLGTVGGVGSEPEAVAVSSDGATAYVADESNDDLYVVDVASLSVVAGPIDLADCSEPETMVISPDDALLYITCAGSSVIRVATAGFGLTTIATGLSDPHGIALNAAGTRLYYTDGTDVLEWDTVAEQLTGTVLPGCDMYGGAVSPDGRRLYCVEESRELLVYEIPYATLLATVDLGTSSARAVALTRDGARCVVPVSGSSSVKVVDAAFAEIPVSGGGFPQPRGVAIGLGGAERLEICNNCLDDDGDGLIDLRDPDCANHVGGSGQGLGDPKGRGKAAVKCQEAIKKAGRKFVTEKQRFLQKCVDAVFECVQRKPDRPRCFERARKKCARKLAAIHDGDRSEEARLRRRILEGCGPRRPGEPPRVEIADLLDPNGLGFSAHAGQCAGLGVPSLQSLDDLAECILRDHECRVEQLLQKEVPRARELLGIGVPTD